jgi:hypothetical protein
MNHHNGMFKVLSGLATLCLVFTGEDTG